MSSKVRIFDFKPTTVADAFSTRVIADGGIVEAKECLNATAKALSDANLLREASLIVTPNGYKTGKCYALTPTTGLGDLTWSRNSGGTRTNKEGYIENVPYNLVSWSEQFEDAVWSKINSTISANSAISPSGNLNADSLIDNSTNSIHVCGNDGGGAGVYTFSFYAKANTINRVGLLTGATVNNTLASTAQVFDLSNGTVVNTISGVTATITNVGNGWYRCSTTLTALAGGTYFITCIKTGTNIGYIGSGESLYLYGAQLVEGSVAKDYMPTTTRLNIPRVDYPVLGGCPSLLVEPQRTNLLLRSEEFEDAVWTKTNVTVSSNTATSPSGLMNADSLTANTVNNYHYAEQIMSVVNSSNYTFSIYLKSNGYNFVLINTPSGSSSGNSGPIINLSTGLIIGTYGTTNYGAQLTNVGNGWYKLSMTILTNSTSLGIHINQFPTSTVATFTGNGTSGISVWGAQLEAGTYPTSYIPTIASTVTRVADVASKTGISSLIGQTEGTLFLDFVYSGLTDTHMIINDASFSSYIYFNSPNANQIWGHIQTSGVQFSMSAIAGRYKCALAYKSGSSVMYVNGVQVGTSSGTFSLSGSISVLNFTFSTPKNNINTSALFKTRLTNTELVQLTTL